MMGDMLAVWANIGMEEIGKNKLAVFLADII